MNIHTQIRETVFDAIAELNQQLPAGRRLEPGESTVLIGPGSPLDSLNIVNLIAALEQKLEERLSVSVDLIDSGLLGEQEPLQTAGALIAFVTGVIGERAHA